MDVPELPGDLLFALGQTVEKERLIRPEGTRSVSYEIFVVGLGRRGTP